MPSATGNPVFTQLWMDFSTACCAGPIHGGKPLLFGCLRFYIISLQENNSIIEGYLNENCHGGTKKNQTAATT